MYKTICFDFDGVLAAYDGWKGREHFGEPVAGMRELLRELKADGWTIIAFTTRGSLEIQEWCEEHDMPADHFNQNPEFTGQNPGKPVASIYVDDLAINFDGDVGKLRENIKTFKPWSGAMRESDWCRDYC